MTKRFGFTLAEVLITLAIIGVVAAMTIPTLIANYQQKSWDTAASVFNRRLGEALKVMNSNSSLAGYTTTQSFVDELGKHIKIVKTCASDKLTDCFASEIATSGNPIDTTTLQKSKKHQGGVKVGVGTSYESLVNSVVKVKGTIQKHKPVFWKHFIQRFLNFLP